MKTFDENLNDQDFASPKYAYRILFVPKTVNRRGQADRVIEFIKSDSPLAEAVNKQYTVIKETEKPKFIAKQVIDIMRQEGYSKFNMHCHTLLWKQLDAKNPAKGFGVIVADKYWHWYEKWIDEVRKHCKAHQDQYCISITQG
jgi:hypothetical protein